jgi:long-subunit acyl-CoA synthetase (AMP-forming)
MDSEMPTPLEFGSRAVGELWICGDQVGRGYLNQANGAFVESYMDIVKKAYRTGDLVRLVDNQLEFLGRRDHQFKVNGMRVDPQEIVAVIQKCCKIQQVHVSMINTQLIAFVPTSIENEDALKAELMRHLPRYMLPTQIIQLDDGFPLNKNGKIDQQRLKEIYLLKNSSTKTPARMQLTEMGQTLARIWSQTIGNSSFLDVDLESNFFELGGHSLSVLKLQAKIKEELAVELTFDQLYRYSNFAEQLALIEDKADNQNDVIQSVRENPDAKVSVYCVHAIGGTIYSYFSMATMWPTTCNIYAIAYDKNYPAQTLKQLSEFYYKQVRVDLIFKSPLFRL